MAVAARDGEGTIGAGSAALKDDEASRIRADALASGQRLVEAARRSADELRGQATRQADAMLRAARAEVDRLTEEANARQVADAMQRVSWDAPGRVLEAAQAEADHSRAAAETQAKALVQDARARAEREAAQIVQAAKDLADQQRHLVGQDIQLVTEDLLQLRQLATVLIARVDHARSRLSALGESRTVSAPASGRDGSKPQGTSLAEPDGTRSSATGSTAGSAPASPSAAPPRPTMLTVVPDPPASLRDSSPSAPASAPARAPDPDSASAGPPPLAASPDVDLVLPQQADRLTVEVMVAVLREQPGITVRSIGRRDGAVIISLTVEQRLPLVPILLELPRVTSARYSPMPWKDGGSQGGHVFIELGGS